MALNTIEDVVKLEEILNLKEEYKDDSTIKGEIIREGVKNRLDEMLALQTTELGRIESNAPNYTEISLRELDAEEAFKEKYKFNKEKKIVVIPLKDFLYELKLSFKQKLQNKIDEMQEELESIKKYLDK
jgi:hypothetical protein